MLNLILFGPPGSGKGTQSIKIAEKYHLVHISTGDIFRREIKNKTELGSKVQNIIEKGELVPDSLLVDILRSALDQAGPTDGYIFDGFPRTLQQAKDLDKLLMERKEVVSMVLALDVNEEEVVTRLLKRAQLEGRKDDTEEVIRNRMKVYHEQTKPLMDFYQTKGKLNILPGIGTIDEIFSNICQVVDRGNN
jgi:adenylate kinase